METRRWAVCLVLTATLSAAVAVALAQAVGGPAPGSARVIEAQEFHVRDAAGNVRARLGLAPDGPILTLWNADGRPQVQLYVDAGGPHLVMSSVLTDANAPEWERYSSAEARLDMGENGPVLSLSDSKGKPRARLSVMKDEPRLELTGKRGGVTLHMGSSGPVAIMSNTAGYPRAVLHLSPDGPYLGVSNASGKPRATLQVGKDRASLKLSDATGKPRATLQVGKDGVSLKLSDPNGHVVWSAPR